jgi:hypothetical protein
MQMYIQLKRGLGISTIGGATKLFHIVISEKAHFDSVITVGKNFSRQGRRLCPKCSGAKWSVLMSRLRLVKTGIG